MKILIRGLLPETPLGNIVSIRSESDPKILKGFTKEQKRIRSEWRNKVAKDKEANVESLEQQFASLEIMIRNAFG